MARKSTITDVAKKAGVGKVTVSYVLNGHAETNRISKTTADRIIQAATELNYTPNAHARNLARKRADAIGVVFQYGDYFGSQSSFITEVLRSVCQACVEADVDVTLHTRPTSAPQEEANFLSDGRVDAVIIIRDVNDPVHNILLDRNFPAVLFFCRSDDPRAAYVSCDNYSGGKMATNHLLQLGHKRIAMLKGSPHSIDSNDRYHGYLSALYSAGIAPNPNYSLAANDEENLKALMLSNQAPTAIFAWSDDSAMDCIRTLNALNISVPQDVSIVGFDGTAAGQRNIPTLTSIAQPIEDIAKSAVQLALQLSKKTSPAKKQIVLPPKLLLNGSTQELSISTSKDQIDKEVNNQNG